MHPCPISGVAPRRNNNFRLWANRGLKPTATLKPSLRDGPSQPGPLRQVRGRPARGRRAERAGASEPVGDRESASRANHRRVRRLPVGDTAEYDSALRWAAWAAAGIRTHRLFPRAAGESRPRTAIPHWGTA